MGIQNLLKLLEKNSTRECHISEFRGCTVAVDSYCWLHKGARSVALQLATGEETYLYVKACVSYIKMLLSYDIKPIMVFDGRYLPAKEKTEERRNDSKKRARQQGIEMLRLGKLNEAINFFKQCIDITPDMALALIRECRKLKVDCIVAPYEADAQLAFFSIKGIADCIISEDSDLLVFGCKKVLYKMDASGVGQLVDADKLHISLKMRPEQFNLDKFRYICILSGCDYVDSLPGIGLKRAQKFISMTAEDNPEVFLDKLPRYLNMRHLNVDATYKENFMTAVATFKHQTVYDPFQRKLVPLNPIDTKAEYCKNSGSIFDPIDAFQLALGNINPLTMKKIDDWQPTGVITSNTSIWSDNYTPRPLKREKANNKSKIKDSEEEEEEIQRVDLDHEQQVGKADHDLLMYYRFIPPTSNPSTPIESNDSESTSPILETSSVNPFIKKKISKFKLTEESPEQNVVQSKFFTSTSSGSTNEDKISEGPVGVEVNVGRSPALFDDVFSEIMKVRVEEDIQVLSQSEKSESDESVQSANKNNYQENPFEAECILEVSDTELDFLDETPALLSVENIPEELSKKRKAPQYYNNKNLKKQATIKEMFLKMSSK